jgi:hypothetical protein
MALEAVSQAKCIAGQPPNNSFKPSPLRGLDGGSYD